jgi:hypothetical protein
VPIPIGEVLAPQAAADIIIAASIANNPQGEDIQLDIATASDIAMTNTVSDEPVFVVDRTTSGLVDGLLRSNRLVILSDQFSEYVHNYPNPFRAGSETTRITYFLEATAQVTVKIYTLAGELVYQRAIAAGLPETQPDVAQEITWDGRNMNGEVVRNGIYVCEVAAGGQTAKFKIAVAK